ncbi:MAG: energy-coupling factor transporter transmembrane component T [Phycisphaerae bacterium]|jgi:energy-coupling factor transport system permease protein
MSDQPDNTHERPTRSCVHSIHPVVKLAWLLWLAVFVFVNSSPVLPVAVAAAAVCVLWIAGTVPWRLPGIRLYLTIGVTIAVIHILVSDEGERIIGPLTTVGLSNAVRVAGRLLAIILLSTLFVMTTEPVALASGLMQLGFPYRWGFTLVTALRLAPVFRLEAHHVRRAQLVRGVAYDAAPPRKWWLMLRRLCFPLIVSALRTAHQLSLSMEGRGFGLHKRRTFARKVPTTKYDGALIVLLLLSVLGGVWWTWSARG